MTQTSWLHLLDLLVSSTIMNYFNSLSSETSMNSYRTTRRHIPEHGFKAVCNRTCVTAPSTWCGRGCCDNSHAPPSRHLFAKGCPPSGWVPRHYWEPNRTWEMGNIHGRWAHSVCRMWLPACHLVTTCDAFQGTTSSRLHTWAAVAQSV
jgi:hypothetical protein